MPYVRRKFNFRRRPRTNRNYNNTRVGAPLGHAPRWRRRQRVAQNLTRNVFWFKETGPIEVLPSGVIFQRYAPSAVISVPAFTRYAYSYEQYKVLKMVVKWYPASVGSESVNPDVFHRGNVVTYIDQPPIEIAAPSSINQVMSRPSARLCQPRRFMKRYIDRPRGGRYQDWGRIEHIVPGGAPAVPPDTWDTQIKIYGDNFGAGPLPGGGPPPPYYFVEIWWKVLFRSRYTQ